MSQYYIGVKQVFAYPEENTKGQPGYHVVYRYGQPDAYHSWSPKEEFEKFYLPMGEGADPNRLNEDMVNDFALEYQTADVGDRTCVAHLKTISGYETVGVTIRRLPGEHDAEAARLAANKAAEQVLEMLCFVLAWARRGLKA